MPHNPLARVPGGAPGSEPVGALPASGPESDLQQGPEYGPDGLYIHGPQRARPSLVRLMADSATGSREDDGVLTPAPHVARQQTRARAADRRRVLDRHARFLAAVRGEPVGANRRRRRFALDAA